MLTEAQARDLLQQAADTIDVGPAGPLDTAPRAGVSWRVVIAAAAAVVVVGVGVFGGIKHGREQDVSPRPADPTIDSQGVIVPSVLGLTSNEAVDLLEGLGLEVHIRSNGLGECGFAGAVGTTPSVGARVDSGSTIRLVASGGDSAADCAVNLALEARLFRFARGLGPAPAIAPTLIVATALGTTTLTRQEAGASEEWKVCNDGECLSPLDDMIDRAQHPPYGSPSKRFMPYLFVHAREAGSATCGSHVDLPSPTAIDVRYPFNGPDIPCGVVDVYLDGHGRIKAIDLVGDSPSQGG